MINYNTNQLASFWTMLFFKNLTNRGLPSFCQVYAFEALVDTYFNLSPINVLCDLSKFQSFQTKEDFPSDIIICNFI